MLTEEFGRGFSRANRQNMRKFYLTYADRLPEICQMTSGKSEDGSLPQINLPKDASIHAREYQLNLPDKELLHRKLIEWGEELGNELTRIALGPSRWLTSCAD